MSMTHDAISAFLAAEGVAEELEQLWADDAPYPQVPSALCYVESPQAVLLLQRQKPPFAGQWTAPGGKIEPGEDPAAAVVREIWEETGLQLQEPRLQVVTSETGPAHYNWLLFVFRAKQFRGELRPGGEGQLRWVPFADLAQLPVPEVDRQLWPYIFPERFPQPRLDPQVGPFFARIRYGEGGTVAQFQVRPLRALPAP